MDVKIAPDWKEILAPEFEKPYFAALTEFVRQEYASRRIFPRGSNIFRAFDKCPFEKDLNGKITAMKTNILEVNRLKAKILALVNQRILELDTSQLGIPIGSLIFPEFFSGKGFRIPVHILSIRNSDAAFSSSFRQAGINQTLHCLTLEVEVDASTLVLGKIEQFSVSSQVAVAETIIVGDVPDTFFHTGGNYGTTEENTGSDGTA